MERKTSSAVVTIDDLISIRDYLKGIKKYNRKKWCNLHISIKLLFQCIYICQLF